jgi:hypothetical protein
MFPGLVAAAYSHCECKQTLEIPKDWEDNSKPEAKNNNSTWIIRAAQIQHTWEYIYICVCVCIATKFDGACLQSLSIDTSVCQNKIYKEIWTREEEVLLGVKNFATN